MKIKTKLLFLATLLLSTQISANVIGTDAQNFNPTTNGIDFVTVHSSKTLEPGILNAGLFFNYAVNTFPVLRSTNPGVGAIQTNNINDTLTSGDFNFGIGLMENWDFGISFPVIFNQTVENTYNLGRFENSGITEVRVNTKYRFTGNDTWGAAAILTVNFNRIENNPYTGLDSGPIVNFELAVNTEISDINLALNVGHRWRSPGAKIVVTGIDPIPNQLIYSGAASYLFEKIDTKVILEILAATPTEKTADASDREQSTLEALLGVKHDVNTHTALHIGAGTELRHGTATPDYRVYAGINYAFGPLFGQKKVQIVTPVQEPGSPYEPEVIALTDLKFDFGSTNLADESIAELDDLVMQLRADVKIIKKIEVEGYTDSVGSEEYNLELSQKRADTVKQFLIDNLSIPDERVTSTGYGEDFSIADNANYQGRATNRRVNLKVFK